MRPAAATALFVCLLTALAVTSAPREVGDAAEYVRMASRLASGHVPSAGESRHFLFYPALAAPVVAAFGALHLNTLDAFTLVNGLLLAAAFYVAVSRVHWTWCALVFAGPILWWLDKPHTEPFTFALFAIAFSLLGSAPWWSLVAAGVSATQNPANAVLVLILAVAAAAGRVGILKDRRFWVGLAAGTALAALHPLYYLLRAGTFSRLAGASDIRWVTRSEFLAALVDPNLGLLPHAPILAAACIGVVVVLLLRAPHRLVSSGVCAAVASGAWLAFVAATATNVNHGGTPGMSRYATWFIPLAIPLFQDVDRLFPRLRRWMIAPVVAAAMLGVWMFHPARVEAPGRPTRLASFLWTHYPSLDNPLPEVFDERLRGLDENWLPVATPGCEKVLLPGRGGRDSVWPMPCAPVTIPARCQTSGALCYANRTATGYGFVTARVSGPQAFRLDRAATWPQSAEPAVADILASLGWWNMSVRPMGSSGAVIRSARNVGRVFSWQAADRLFVFAADVQPGAELVVEPARAMSGGFTTEDGAIESLRVELRPGTGAQSVPLPAPQPWVILIVEAR
jgi:hypothetical protein